MDIPLSIKTVTVRTRDYGTYRFHKCGENVYLTAQQHDRVFFEQEKKFEGVVTAFNQPLRVGQKLDVTYRKYKVNNDLTKKKYHLDGEIIQIIIEE